MPHGKSPADIDVVADVLGQFLEVIVPSLKVHGPVSYQWPKPKVMIDAILFTHINMYKSYIQSKYFVIDPLPL